MNLTILLCTLCSLLFLMIGGYTLSTDIIRACVNNQSIELVNNVTITCKVVGVEYE